MNFQMFKLDLEKGRIIKKARKFQENIYFCFINYAKAFDRVDHKKNCGRILEMGLPRPAS